MTIMSASQYKLAAINTLYNSFSARGLETKIVGPKQLPDLVSLSVLSHCVWSVQAGEGWESLHTGQLLLRLLPVALAEFARLVTGVRSTAFGLPTG